MARKKVLVVDDSFTVRKTLVQMIRRGLQCEVQQAGDGSEALQAMINDTPDLLILDIMMPFMNGVEVLKTMRQNDMLKNIPVIACTSLDNDTAVKEIIKLGVKDYMIKPVDKDSLVKKVEQLLT